MSWIEDRITDYYKWVRERVKVRTDETTGWSVISTPFLGAYNDPIEIFIRTNGENIELSDDGVIFDNLRQLGVNVNRSLKRKEWVEYILRNYGVTIEDNYAQLPLWKISRKRNTVCYVPCWKYLKWKCWLKIMLLQYSKKMLKVSSTKTILYILHSSS